MSPRKRGAQRRGGRLPSLSAAQPFSSRGSCSRTLFSALPSEDSVETQADQARVLADRYVGGMGKLDNHQKLWRQKHDALVRRKNAIRASRDLASAPETVSSAESTKTEANNPVLGPASQQRSSYRLATPSCPSGTRRRSGRDPRLRWMRTACDALAENVPQNAVSEVASGDTASEPTPSVSSPCSRFKRWHAYLSSAGAESEARDCRERKLRSGSVDFEACVALAKKHSIAFGEVQKRHQDFCALDKNDDGILCKEEFENAIRRKCKLTVDEPIPSHLLGEYLRADKDENGSVSFEEFLLWNYNHAFSEELVVDEAQIALRRLARKFSLDIVSVERIKATFDKYDCAGSGSIDQPEFKKCVADLWQAKSEDVSPNRLKQFWMEVDTDKSGDIDFEEFLTWFTRLGIV